MRFAITNCRLFDGVQFHFNKAVLVNDGRIEALTAASTIPTMRKFTMPRAAISSLA